MRKYLISIAAMLAMLTASAQNEKYVNMFLGTSGDHGQMSPAAAVPFGAIAVGPDSSPNSHVGYDYAVETVSGVSINRVSGVGCSGTGCNLSVKPALPGDVLKIVKGSEVAYPGYYATAFDNGVKGEFTATKNMAVERYTFPREGRKLLYVDFSASVDKNNVSSEYKVESANLITGHVNSPTACSKGSYRLYFNFEVNSDFKVVESNPTNAVLEFAADVEQVEVRIAVSAVSQIAADDIAIDWSEKSFDKLLKEARQQWREKLNQIQVKGSTEDQRTIFYTLLYRVYLSPMDVTTNDGRYKATDGKIYDADGFNYYSSWSMWDSFRTKFPLLTIVEPEVMSDIVMSLLHQYRTGKANWATPHESVPTVRTEHSGVVILDAWKKGIRNVDLKVGYEGLKREAAHDLLYRTPDQRLESSYDLWALGQIAELVGEKEDAKMYSAKADSLFDATWPTEFMTIRDDFVKMRGNGLYQGTRWQYRWAAPHCFDKMIALVGKEKLAEQIDYFFKNDLFNQGNEPDIHTPLLYNVFGNPEGSQRLVRDLLTKEDMVHRYGGNAEYPTPFVGRAFQNKLDGFAPEMDEDDGTMSAWYVFCSMGFYPVVVGDNTYEMVSPLYDKVKIRSGANTVTIRTVGRKSADDLIRSIEIDGKPMEGYTLSHDVFLKDSKITIRY